MSVLEPEYFAVEGVEGEWPRDNASREERNARGLASQAAESRALELNQQGSADWRVRWVLNESRYCVEPRPFEPPSKVWSETNSPIFRRTNLEKYPTKFVPLDTLLVAARDLGIFQWLVADERPANAAGFIVDLQAALDLQYGRGRFYAHRHGNRVSVQCRYPIDE